MLFQTQKRLLTERVERAMPAVKKATDPTDPAQYVTFQSDGKSLTQTNVRNDIAVKQVIDNAGDDLKLNGTWAYAFAGEILYEILTKSNVLDKISATFEPGADTIKSQAPDKQPVNLLGNFAINFPGEEKWEIPVVDFNSVSIPTNPQIDLNGANKMKVPLNEFSQFLAKVGLSVGKDGGNANYRQVMIRSKGAQYEIITATPGTLALAKAKARSSSGDFSMTIPYEHVLTATKILDPDQDIEIIHNPGSPGTAVFCQDIKYSDRTIGKIYVRLTCSNDPFAKFEKMVNSLSFVNSVTLKTQQLRPICSRLEILKGARTELVIDTAKKSLVFAKKEAGRAKVSNMKLDFVNVTGGDFSISITSRILAECVGNAELEELEWRFSGKSSLSHVRIVHRTDGATLDCYFPPFPEDE